jgi:hypothetical protein
VMLVWNALLCLFCAPSHVARSPAAPSLASPPPHHPSARFTRFAAAVPTCLCSREQVLMAGRFMVLARRYLSSKGPIPPLPHASAPRAAH